MDASGYLLSGDYKYIAFESNYTKVRNSLSVLVSTVVTDKCHLKGPLGCRGGEIQTRNFNIHNINEEKYKLRNI